MTWKKVGNEWHKFAGQVNLFLNVTRRRRAFIQSELLADAIIESGNEAVV